VDKTFLSSVRQTSLKIENTERTTHVMNFNFDNYASHLAIPFSLSFMITEFTHDQKLLFQLATLVASGGKSLEATSAGYLCIAFTAHGCLKTTVLYYSTFQTTSTSLTLFSNAQRKNRLSFCTVVCVLVCVQLARVLGLR
jgi:hypothetical protein